MMNQMCNLDRRDVHTELLVEKPLGKQLLGETRKLKNDIKVDLRDIQVNDSGLFDGRIWYC
jgi:hypothetical protein